MVTQLREQTLLHVRRYRVATIHTVNAALYGDEQFEAARKTLARLVDTGYLWRSECQSRSFYQLTPRGCAETGAPRHLAKPLQAQGLIDRYSIVAFCTLQKEKRSCLLPSELLRAFPHLMGARDIDPSLQHYYVSRATNGKTCLGRATVDNGACVRTLALKSRQILERAAVGALAPLLTSEEFVLTVLTPTDEKANRLRALLDRHSPLAAPVAVAVVPQMLHVFV